MKRCKHERTETGPEFGFAGSIAVEPYTHENEIAHGGIRYAEKCLDCGAVRNVLSNAQQYEYSPWQRV